MGNENKNSYLTDEQLQDLIAGVEMDIHQAPEYLEQVILRKAEPVLVKESLEIVPIRHAIIDGKPIQTDKVSGKKQFQSYTIKIVAATAAALALLITMPNPDNITLPQKTDISADNSGMAMKNINKKTSDLCSFILEKTNQLFQKEEQLYD